MMAKLSAYGRSELLRMERTHPPDEITPNESRHTVAVMSDGVILEKFSNGSYRSGWTRKGRIKPGVSLAALRARYEQRGYRMCP